MNCTTSTAPITWRGDTSITRRCQWPFCGWREQCSEIRWWRCGSQRRWLRTRWPWLAGAAAVALFTPHIIWQVRHDWPTLEFMRNAVRYKLPEKSAVTFLGEQALMLQPVAVPFWIAGLLYYSVTRPGRPYRPLAWIWATVIVTLMASGHARSNYSGPAYVILLAAGGVAVERLARAHSWRWLPPVVAGVFVTAGAVIVPFAIDWLPPADYVAYERAVGLTAPTDERTQLGALPLHFALRFGWPELTRTVTRVYQGLPAEERAQAGIIAETFGEAAALNFFGPQAGLPHAIGTLNNYWLWGPGHYTGEIMLVIASPESRLLRLFRQVERTAPIHCHYCMPDLAHKFVYICRHSRRPLSDLWPQLRHYE
ncbi:MAG: hypothetical protein ACE5I7_05560 [Candidatus Binatia bacterium]